MDKAEKEKKGRGKERKGNAPGWGDLPCICVLESVGASHLPCTMHDAPFDDPSEREDILVGWKWGCKVREAKCLLSGCIYIFLLLMCWLRLLVCMYSYLCAVDVLATSFWSVCIHISCAIDVLARVE